MKKKFTRTLAALEVLVKAWKVWGTVLAFSVLAVLLALVVKNADKNWRSRCEEVGHELHVPTKYLHGRCFAFQQGRWKEILQP